MKINLALLGALLLLLLLSVFWPEISSDSVYPVPKVRIYVPSKPGGTTDATARAVARSLERHTGVKAVVINQTAGGGSVAVASVADAKADGATLLLFHAMLHVAHQTGKTAVSALDLTPLATVSRASDVFVVRSDAPYDNLPGLFSHASSRQLTIASQMGGTTQLKASALANAATAHGGTLRPVAIGSMAKRITALLGGQVDISIVDLKTARQYLDAGSVKPLAVISGARDPFEPDWPTTVEQGVDIDLPQVGELYAPGGLDSATRERLARLLEKVLLDPELELELARVKQAPDYRGPEEALDFIRRENSRVVEWLRPAS